jgi:chromosome segregation ATPase
MAYKIIQHRRGTEQEWRELNLVPFEGELVIEECAGNIYKCKVGDGITPFTDLPYITKAAELDFDEKLRKQYEQVLADLALVKNEVSQNISVAKGELSDDISEVDEKVGGLDSEIKALSVELDRIDKAVKDFVDSEIDIEDFETKYKGSLDKIASQHTTDIATLNTTIETKVREVTSAFEAADAQAKSGFESEIAAAKADLTEDYEANIEAVEGRLQAEITTVKETLRQHTKDLGSTQNSIVELQTALDDKSSEIDEKVSASEGRTNTSITTVQKAIAQINLTIEQLEKAIAAKDESNSNSNVNGPNNMGSSDILPILIEQLDDLQYKVKQLENANGTTAAEMQAVNIELARLSASITNGLAQQKASLNALTKNINSLDSKFSNADSDIIAAVASSNKEINEELASLANTDISLHQTIYKIRDELIKKVDSADAYLQAELKEDVSILTQNVNDIKIKVDSQLTDTKAAVAESLTEAKAELTKKIDKLAKTQGDDLATNKKALNELTATVAANYANVTGVVEALAIEVESTKNAITDTSATVNQINTSVNNKVSLLNTGLDTLSTRLDTQVTGVENRLQTKIDATDLEVQQHAESLQRIKDNINDLDEELDSRIAEQVSTGVAGPNASIIELREALAQLKLTIEQIKNEPNGGISKELATLIDEIQEELIGLANDDIVLYQIIYKIRDELLIEVGRVQTELQSSIQTEVATINQNISSTKEALVADLTAAQNTLLDKLALADEALRKEISIVDTFTRAKISANEQAIKDLHSIVEDNQTLQASAVTRVSIEANKNKSNIAKNSAAINRVEAELSDKVELINDNVNYLDNRLDVQDKRIDELVAFDLKNFTLNDGEIAKEDFAKLVQEVADIRSGYDGVTHPSAQAAVRDIGNNLSKLQNSLAQYIGTKAIDGLYYDVTGEVGLMQPYMLYLKTADGEVIQDSGVQIIGGAGGIGGGGSSTLKIIYDARSPQEIKVTPSNEVKVYFTFSGTDSSGDIIRKASATWRIDGVVVERGTITDGENYFDATKYVKDGTIKVHLTVNDDNGSTATKSWEIQQINLKIESDFFDKKDYSVGEKIIFDFKPTGAVNKVARFILDGDELGVDLEVPGFPMTLDETKSGTTVYCNLPALDHGSHLLEVYLEADINGITVSSDHIFKDIICFDASDRTKPPVIGTVDQSIITKQYSTTNIVYTVYSHTTDTPVVDIVIDGNLVSKDYIVRPNKDYGNTPTAVYPYVATEPGTHEIKIICEGTEKVIDVFVEDLGLNISPVTTGLAFDFNPAGRNNGDSWSDRGVSLTVSDNFDWTNGGYLPNDPDGPCFCIKAGTTATISHNLFENEAKESGKEFKLVFKTKNVAKPDAVFLSCLDSDTDPARVGLQMGVHNATIYGKSNSLELAYSEEDVIEFEFNISKYSDAADALNMVMGYEDGVPSRPMVYDSSYSFKQDSDNVQPITIGSPDCDVYIYRLKVYNISLSTADILNNFIADARTAEEMVNRYTRNQIYDKNRKLTPEALAEKCPWLRVIKISAPKFTSSKKDNIGKTTIQQIYGQGRPSDNWVAYDAVHSGQGTSSDNYGAAGRNIDLKVRIVEDKNGNPINTNPYFLLSDDTVVDKVSLTDTSIPVDYFNIKVNIASSNNLTNAIIAKRYNEFNPYKRPYVREDEAIVPYLKDTMEFYNCVVFIQETDPDVTTHREFADNDWHFYAIGNIGDSKKTDKTRLTDPSDKYECCVEIMDVGLALSGFPRDTMIDAMGLTKDGSEYIWAKNENLNILYEREYSLTADSEINLNKTYYIEVDGKMVNAMEYTITEVRDYIWAKNENLGLLYELIDGDYVKTEDTEVDLDKVYYIEVEEKDGDGNVIGTIFSDAMGYTTKEVKIYTYAKNENLNRLYEVAYFKTADTEVNYNKTYYVDILEHDDFSEDYTYGWRYISDDEDPDVVNTCKQAWIDFYRFVTTSTDEDFKAHIEDYFVKDSALYYYLFTTRYCMVDNRAKNTFWHYGKTVDGTRKWDLCWDYDNDTSLGLNNYGKQVYRYGLEDTDHDATGEEVFRQSDSTFFCRIRDLFGTELRNMYQSLESSNAWNANAFINECDAWQEQFPEELWRVDIERKYIRTYTSSFINGGSWKQGLTTMANGRMKYHRRQWERNQEQYMASKYQTTAALGDAAHANFRVGRPSAENLVVAPNYQFTLTPYSYIYLNVQYGGTSPISVRATPNVPTVIPYAGTSADIINVGSAAAISDFGDLSALYPKTASVQNATRIKKLKLGNTTTGYSNTLFQSLDTGNNNLLEELDITNITSYTGALDLKKLINLKKLYAFGTGLSSISFADGGKLSYAELPAVNSLTLKRLIYLSTDSLKLSYSNVADLVVEGCPLIDQAVLFNNCTSCEPENLKLKRVRLDNIDFGIVSYTDFTSKMFKLKGISPTGSELPNAVITGKVQFSDDKLTGAQYNQIKQRYPDLKVSYNELESTLKFMGVDNETELLAARQIIMNGQDGTAPSKDITDTLIKAPSDDGEFTYSWIGWSTEPNSNKVDENALKDVEGDRILYPVFEAATRQYEVRFINPTNNNEVLHSVMVSYGKPATYPLEDPENKNDPTVNKLYAFVGWVTEDGNPLGVVTGTTDYYAQFAVKDQNSETGSDDGDDLPGYTLGLLDIEYTTTSGSTITITKCKNEFNTAVSVPKSITIGTAPYNITSIGAECFRKHDNLEIIMLPESLEEIQINAFRESALVDFSSPTGLKTISDRAFQACTALRTVNISAGVSSIGNYVFDECSRLSKFNVDAANKNYKALQDGKILLETTTGTLKQGLDGAALTKDMTITQLGEYCFRGKDITVAQIPDNITTIPSNAFNNCSNLTNVSLPSGLKSLGAACFASTSINEITLPGSLTSLATWVFHSCPLEVVIIPEKVTTINGRAFGNITTLTAVIFKNMPTTIASNTFQDSGSSEGLTFYVPWNKETHTTTFGEDFVWGAKNATIVYNHKEENT